jgi:hypothetical protein
MTLHAKNGVARFVALLLERGRAYSASELDKLISESIRADVLNDSRCAPDHIRLQMLENKYLERDSAAGVIYHVHPAFVLPSEMDNVFEELERQAKNAAPSDRFICPVCYFNCNARTLVDHFLQRHKLTQEWEQLMSEYSR